MSGIRNLKARYVFPVSAKPVRDGVVSILNDRILGVQNTAPGGPVEDLGNVAILPGLINPHVHLEFSHLEEPLGEPGISLTDWIRRVVEFRRHTVRAAGEPVQRGLQESLRCGTTTLCEIAQPGWPAELFAAAPLHATVFLELIAPTTPRVAPALELADAHLQPAPQSGPWHVGLSPHAPYSAHPQLLAAVVSLSAAARVPLAFHLAESREELQFLQSGKGPFRELLEQFEAWDPSAIRPGTQPLDYLHTLAGAHRTLVIHGNYLDDREIAFLAQNAQRMAVVYCPRTHAWFKHAPYPLEKLLCSGATVALGTDSRASAPDLSVLAEMRFVAQTHGGLSGHVVLELATIRAARALGQDHRIGSLESGKSADLTIVALPDRDAPDPYELFLDSDEPVVATWHAGMKRNDQP